MAIMAVGLLNGILVVLGFGITWLSTLKRYQLDCNTQRLQSELRRTEQQLEALFGPVRAISHATEAGFTSFVAEHCSDTPSASSGGGAGASFWHLPAYTPMQGQDLERRIRKRPSSLEAWRYRRMIASTLQPLNRRVMETILNHTHLIDGEFPDCLYALYSHVIEMDSLLQRWERGDFSVMFPPTPYPGGVNRWAGQEFERLRQKQKSLMSDLEGY